MTDELRPDQIEDLSHLIGNKRWGLLNDPGTGKTPVVCAHTEWVWEDLGGKTIWPQPGSLLEKNKDELLRWTNLTEKQVSIFDGSNYDPNVVVYLMNFKRFSMSWRDIIGEQEKAFKRGTLLVDEIHMGFSTHDSQRTRELYMAGYRVDRFVPMTGSLIAGRLNSAYPTIRMIEPRYYASHQNFMAIHAEYDEWGKVTGWKNHERLNLILGKHSSRRTFESVFGKQAVVLLAERVQMAPRQLEQYRKFEKEALLELEDRFMDGSVPGVNTIRCRQIMAHPEDVSLPILWNDKGKPIKFKTYNLLGKNEMTGKEQRLEVHLNDHLLSGKPLVIYAALVPEQIRIYKLCEKMGFRVGLMNGMVSDKARAVLDKKFIAGELDIIVGSPLTSAVGWNWGFVDHIIFASLDYMDTNLIQAIRRAIRGKRNKPLLVTFLEYARSIDQRIFQIVKRKSEDAHKVDNSYEVIDLASCRVNIDVPVSTVLD